MFYVELDAHLKSYVVCVLDSKGNIVQRATTKNIDQLLDLLAKLLFLEMVPHVHVPPSEVSKSGNCAAFRASACERPKRSSPSSTIRIDSSIVKTYFKRICRNDKDRRKIAVVATPHDLVRVIWAMLKRGEMWSKTVKAN